METLSNVPNEAKNNWKPELSVIIPVLNESKYLEKTLKSVLNQDTNIAYEVIVSDNGSIDGSIDIAKKYIDRIVHCKEAGTGATRHFGAMNANENSKYFVFIDADTIIPQNYLAYVYEMFKTKTEVTAFSTTFEFSGYSKQIKLLGYLVNKAWLARDKLQSVLLPGYNTCVRKEDYFRCGGYRNTYLEDIEFGKRITKIGRVRFFPNIKVITSSRRFESMGLIGALNYYVLLYMKYDTTRNTKSIDE